MDAERKNFVYGSTDEEGNVLIQVPYATVDEKLPTGSLMR